MNYRHAYHAGNFADAFKHAALIALLDSFKAKPAPFCYFDTHAGRGLYDLVGEAARKTHEADAGALRLLALPALPPALQPWADLVRHVNARDGATAIRRYPGSPLIAERLLRDCDSAVLCELQPAEAAALRALLRQRKHFHVHQRDGYEALRALVPPVEKRGLALIDPPFEGEDSEFARIQAALEVALARWPQGRFAVWYPVKLRQDRNAFLRWLKERCPGDWLVGEFLVHPDNSRLRLNGCGLAIIHPPWHFERTLHAILDALCAHLAQDGFSAKRVESSTAAATPG